MVIITSPHTQAPSLPISEQIPISHNPIKKPEEFSVELIKHIHTWINDAKQQNEKIPPEHNGIPIRFVQKLINQLNHLSPKQVVDVQRSIEKHDPQLFKNFKELFQSQLAKIRGPAWFYEYLIKESRPPRKKHTPKESKTT